MQRKKLDNRVPTLISNGVQLNHRSFFVVVGDRGKDQVVTLHYLLAKARVAARPNVLWCYKKDLGFTSHRKKRAKQIKSQIARGIRDADQDDPFELFVSSTNVRYTYYKETEKVLGQTFGMLVLQDFEAISPNILARTIETVEGGGIVILLLRTMQSLKQLYTMTMDVHKRYRTESHQETTARFNERFILSLGNCQNCLFMDDELNILPLSIAKSIKLIPKKEETKLSADDKELAELKLSLQDTQPLGALVSCAKTLDQAKAILTFVEATAEKTLRSTVSLTAARGRGKSAALGIAIAASVAYGYSNIFLTSPTPENLKTLFEFIFIGFDALGYEEHLDYDIIQSTDPALQKSVVRVNVFRDHRQTIQYIQPQDHHVLSQAELLVIDEAAAIPLPVVQKLLGPYLVFMASTINGYEGTGRSLSLKLLKQLRTQSTATTTSSDSISVDRTGKESAATSSNQTGRALREIELKTPIRYGAKDPVERWLNTLLCLDCSNPTMSSQIFSGAVLTGKGPSGCPHPSQCELFYVNRDTLFSFHPVSEAFLQRMMALYVASHYKNSPNDLQLMSDAPAHHLFVLLPPMTDDTTTLPDPLVVVQVCMEGQISKESVISSMSKGERHAGDMIPWVMSQQFQDDDFAQLSGARIVRIATHPDYIGMGYGKRAVELVEQYYENKFVDLNEDDVVGDDMEVSKVTDADLQGVNLMTDEVRIRDPVTMPALLLKLSERPLLSSEKLHWLGVSFGLTSQLHKFWKRGGFIPLYIRQTQNEITGEHSCVMMKSLNNESPSGTIVKVERPSWLVDFSWDFRRRLIQLLGLQFKTFSAITVLSILEAIGASRSGNNDLSNSRVIIETKTEVYRNFTPFDLKRLDSYSNNLLDYHVIIDLIPALAQQFFLGQYNPSTTGIKNGMQKVSLSPVQGTILLGIGLQKKTVDEIEKELGLPKSQVLALFGKMVKKICGYLNFVVEVGVKNEVEEEDLTLKKSVKKASNGLEKLVEEGDKWKNPHDETEWDPTAQSLNEDLENGGNEFIEKLARQKEIIDSMDLTKYAIGGNDEDWDKAEMGNKSKIVNIPNSEKSSKKRKLTTGTAADLASKNMGEKTGIVDPTNLLGSKKKGGKDRRNKKK